ncbi:MAG: cyclic nucleotide-binding domain-containing protein [Anaerolineae bacterium]
MADRFVLSNARRLPIFARLDAQQMDWIASVMQVLRYQAGEEIFRQGDAIAGLFMFVSGSGLLTQRAADGVERPFGNVTEGQFVNEAALFTDTPATTTLRVNEESLVLFLSRQQMRNVLAHHPEIRSALNISAAAAQTQAPANRFEQQRANETVIMETRRHIGGFLSRAVGLSIIIILVWIMSIILAGTLTGFPILIITLPVTAFLLLLIAYHYAEWHNDQFVITDRRVVNIQRTILNFNTRINEIPLDSIKEINVKLPPVTDIAGRLLNYGSIIIKTSGDTNNIRLDEIPDPKGVQQAIFTHRQRFQEIRAEEQRKAIRGEVARLVGADAPGSAAGGGGNLPGMNAQPGLFSMEYTNSNGDTVYRKHWLAWVGHVILPTLLILGGMTLLLVNLVPPLIPFAIVGVGVFWFYLGDWDWRNDMYIVGDQTITIIHRRPLFLQDEKDQILLAQVDNVVSDTRGFVNSIFQVGEVKLLLTGTDEKNAKRFTMVYAPQRIQQEISRRQDRANALKQESEALRQQQAIKDYLAVYHETTAPQQPAGSPLPGAQNATLPLASPPAYPGYSPPAEDDQMQPPRVRDRSRPPGIPRVIRRDQTSGSD